MRFHDVVTTAPAILAEGAVIERLRRMADVKLDPHILHAGLVDEVVGRAALAAIYDDYLDIGAARDLPLIVCTPTWRANPERLRTAGYADVQRVNADGVRLLADLRASRGSYARQVYIGGLLGCRGDAYRPTDALSAGAAAEFHRPQAHALSSAGVDFLLAATLPAASEAFGMATAMAETGVPYLLSFVVRSSGALLDGSSLDAAIARIDATASPPPAGYLVNCVHPSVFATAMDDCGAARERIIGLQANTSRRSPEELDESAQLDGEVPEMFAQAMLEVRRRFGLRIVGGCCGTDARHIRCIAAGLRAGG